MAVWVLTGRQASASDQSAVSRGIAARELMQAAGRRAADVTLRCFPDAASRGVAVFTGAGNNGGDGFVAAQVLTSYGIPVTVTRVLEPRSSDALWAQQLYTDFSAGIPSAPRRPLQPGLVLDAVLGTGSSGPPRSAVQSAIVGMHELQGKGAAIVALDLPSGLPSDQRADWETVRADLTISFGALKRGQLLNRVPCGELRVVDIGHTASDLEGADRLQLITPEWVRARVPAAPTQGHKGDRGKLVILGGAPGMAGAVALAARAAFHSGVGMVHCCVHPDSLSAIQVLVPTATASVWPSHTDTGFAWDGWPDALLIGPGLGLGSHQRHLVAAALQLNTLPAVIDADGLTAFSEDVTRLASWLKSRRSVITPHAGEAGALVRLPARTVMDERFAVAPAMASSLGTCVLLKGSPTVVAAPDEPPRVSARGNAVLASGGSGDILGGVVATLLAQQCTPSHAASIGAFIHGRAAELLINKYETIRGVPIEEIIGALRMAWQEPMVQHRPGEIAVLPALPNE